MGSQTKVEICVCEWADVVMTLCYYRGLSIIVIGFSLFAFRLGHGGWRGGGRVSRADVLLLPPPHTSL